MLYSEKNASALINDYQTIFWYFSIIFSSSLNQGSSVFFTSILDLQKKEKDNCVQLAKSGLQKHNILFDASTTKAGIGFSHRVK